MSTPEEAQDNFYYIDVPDSEYGPIRLKGTKEQIALARELLKREKLSTVIVQKTGVTLITQYNNIITRESIQRETERLRDKARHDEAQALHHARLKGIQEGIREARQEGIQEVDIKVARNLLAMGMPVDQIVQVTGLTLKEIELLQS